MKTAQLKTIEQTNSLFRECLAQVSDKTRAEFNLSFEIADRIEAILKKQGLTQKELAARMGKRESEVSRWLTGRHNFTTNTLADIALALGEPIVNVPVGN